MTQNYDTSNRIFDVTKPVCTRDGRRAWITKVGACGPTPYVIRAKLEHPNHSDTFIYLSFTCEGRLKTGDNRSCHDLINKMVWHDWLRS